MNTITPENKTAVEEVSIVMVETAKERDTFIRLPWKLYADDPVWVPPLLMERKDHFSRKNPYFEHASCQLWLAVREGNVVGRISAQIDQLHLERYGDDTGFWGMFECEDNIETAKALFVAAETWLQSQGMKRAMGPFNFSINHDCGLLVDGFNTPPAMMMGHARPYYAGLVEGCGYQKAKDLLAYMIDSQVEPSASRKRIVRSTAKKIQTRPLNKAQFDQDLAIIFSIFNDAWADNWGFLPFTEPELSHLANDLKLLINERFVRIAYIGEEPAAFLVLLPNLNEAIADLNGSLFPFGWAKLLWRLKVKSPKSGRILLMGVLSKYHEKMIGAGLAYRVIHDMQEDAVKAGIEKAELSWILEDNIGVRSIIEDSGGVAYKTYRIYERTM